MRDQLESIVQTKVNSINIENEASKNSASTGTVTIPTPAPRKVSPKNHHAPPIPCSQESKNFENSYKNQNLETKNGILNAVKNKKPAAPRPPHSERRAPEKRGKINIKMSDIESSGTNYSNLEWKK